MKRGSSYMKPRKGKQHVRRFGNYNAYNNEETSFILFHNSSASSESGGEEQLSLSKVKEQCIERELQPNDTLQSLALEFNCPVSELKRVNKILRENEIFARKVIKIPIRYYSLLTEQLASVHTAAKSKQETAPVEAEKIEISNYSVEQVVTDDVPHAEEESESHALLLSSSADNIPKVETDGLACSGSDWGLSWPYVLLCAVILGIVGPVIYIYVITEKSKKHHS